MGRTTRTEIGPGFVSGRWTVLGEAPSRPAYWLCRCECGTEKEVLKGNVASGHSQSCECLRKERVAEVATTHGYTTGGKAAYEYEFWMQMRKNCGNESRDSYDLYGGKGIRVHPAWQDSFEQFLKDVGPRPAEGMVLGRKNKKKHFAPGNVTWMTSGQRQLRKSDMRLVTIGGVTKQLIEWCRESGIKKNTLHYRLQHWPEERWLEPPVEKVRRAGR